MSDYVDNDDARRQALMSSFFYFAGDLLSGVDSNPRMENGEVGGPMLGPRTNGADVGVGAGGEIFARGQARQVGTQQTREPQGLVLSPGLLIVGALVLYLAMRR